VECCVQVKTNMFDFNYKNECIYFKYSNETYAPWRRCHDRKIWHKNALNETVSIPTKVLYDTALRNPKQDGVSRVLQREKRDDARKAWTWPTVPHYIAEGLIEGTWCRGIYVSLVDLTHNTPIFISSKQWWIGMCSVYLGRMICDDGWTLQWFTELFVGTLQ
jgi:hypothetical protein